MEGQFRFRAADGQFLVLPLEQIDLKATQATNVSAMNQEIKEAPQPHIFTNEELPDGLELYPDQPQRPEVAALSARGNVRGPASSQVPDAMSGVALFDDALRDRSRRSKPIALYFYTSWCGYCKQLDRLLGSPDVRQYLDSILYVPINAEAGENEKALFHRYGGRGYPHFVMLSARSNQTTQILPFTRNAEKKTVLQTPAEFVLECVKAGG
jgi:thiol-disulfide isomerase/thioredoxin